MCAPPRGQGGSPCTPLPAAGRREQPASREQHPARHCYTPHLPFLWGPVPITQFMSLLYHQPSSLIPGTEENAELGGCQRDCCRNCPKLNLAKKDGEGLVFTLLAPRVLTTEPRHSLKPRGSPVTQIRAGRVKAAGPATSEE